MRIYKDIFATLSQSLVWLTLLVMTVFFAVTGPFGTFNTLSFEWRLIYWAPILLVATLITAIAKNVAIRMAGKTTLRSYKPLAVVLFALIFSPILVLYDAVWGTGTALSSTQVFRSSGFVLIMAIGATIGWSLLMRSLRAPDTTVSATPPRLNARLVATDGEVARLTVDDHYVDVYLTDGRTERLLMRFADAVNEMDGTDGFCVHRSHWVAKASIVDMFKKGTKEFLTLACGTQVPVSRTYRQNVIDAGFTPKATQ